MRKFKSLRTGKYIAQACHACMAIFFKHMIKMANGNILLENLPYFEDYINGMFKKIVVYVDSEEELLEIYRKGQLAEIHSSLIRDAGLTEFNNVPTYTAVAIGPWDSEEIDKITGHLKLL